MKRWLIWTIFVVGWTLALEAPTFDTSDMSHGESYLTYKYFLGKTFHIAMYGVMAWLSGWVPLPSRHRILLMYFLMVHATLTELLQLKLFTYFHRTGTLEDVALDHFGVLLGLIVNWKPWTRSDGSDALPAPAGLARAQANYHDTEEIKTR